MILSQSQKISGRTVLVYLARGADDGCHAQFEKFVRAYQVYPAGLTHDLVVVFKGFSSEASLEAGRKMFAGVTFEEVHVDDLKLDIGAYAEVVHQIECDRICFLNTTSEPASTDWLLKLALNLEQPGVGLVGATGSFEGGAVGPSFPNVHVRTNAFMMHAPLARQILGGFEIGSKVDAYHAEHGFNSITRQVVASGLVPLVVGRNGRGYSPEWWSSSQTFRQGSQANVLVHDGQTRRFAALAWNQKRSVYLSTWGGRRTPGLPFSYATP
jgi:hypothetical protein